MNSVRSRPRPPVLHRVLEERVQRGTKAFGIDGKLPRREWTEVPGARRHLGPAHEDILQAGLEVDLLGDDEVGLVCFREQQQSRKNLFDSLQLVERDVDFLTPRCRSCV